MINSVRKKSIYELPLYLKLIIGLCVFAIGVVVFLIAPTYAMDWRFAFSLVSRVPLNPYSVTAFFNPPWTALILYPLHFLPQDIGLAVNLSLNVVIIGLLVIKRKGDLLALVLTLTSFPFLSLLANGNIEWMPALAFIFQNGYGIPFLLAKPQSGVFAALAWFQKAKNKWVFILPGLITVVLSFIIWKNWLLAILANIHYANANKLGLFTVSASFFPWLIPLGLGLLYYVFKYKPVDSEILGTLATFFLVPYFVVHSLTILFALISISHRRIALACWALLWAYPILGHWATFIHLLGFR
jgi:hypothetical protein